MVLVINKPEAKLFVVRQFLEGHPVLRSNIWNPAPAGTAVASDASKINTLTKVLYSFGSFFTFWIVTLTSLKPDWRRAAVYLKQKQEKVTFRDAGRCERGDEKARPAVKDELRSLGLSGHTRSAALSLKKTDSALKNKDKPKLTPVVLASRIKPRLPEHQSYLAAPGWHARGARFYFVRLKTKHTC